MSTLRLRYTTSSSRAVGCSIFRLHRSRLQQLRPGDLTKRSSFARERYASVMLTFSGLCARCGTDGVRFTSTRNGARCGMGYSAGDLFRALHPLDYRSHSLADSDAHRAERIMAAGLLQFMSGRQKKACTRHPKGMAKRDGATVGV